MGISEKQVRRRANRLQEAGYDMDAWNAKMASNIGALSNQPEKVAVKVQRQKKITNERYYAALMKALDTPDSYRIKDVAGDILGLSTRDIRRIANRLKEAGFDMAEWEYAMRHNQSTAYKARKAAERVERPVALPKHATPLNEACVLQRSQWLSDMRKVANRPEPRRELEALWKVPAKTAHSRITILRRAGHDLSWWVASPSNGFGNADKAMETRLEQIRQAQVTRKAIAEKIEQEANNPASVSKVITETKWAPKTILLGSISYVEIPYTIHAIAEIAGVSLNRARFAARALEVPFSQIMIPNSTAVQILESLGFITKREVAA